MNKTGKVTPSSKWAIAAMITFGMVTAIELAEIGVYIVREIFYLDIADSGVVSPGGIDADINRVDQVTFWDIPIYIAAALFMIIWLHSAKRILLALRASGAKSSLRWSRVQAHFSFFKLMIPLRYVDEGKSQGTDERDGPDNLRMTGYFLLSISWLVLMITSAFLWGFANGRIADLYRCCYLCKFLTQEQAKIFARGILFWNKWVILGHFIGLVAALLALALIKKINSGLNQIYMELLDADRSVNFSAPATDPAAGRSGITPGFFQRAGGIVLVLIGSVVLIGAIGSMVSGTSKGTLISQILAMTIAGVFPWLGGAYLYLRGLRKKRQSRAERVGVESPEPGDS
ncbi:MAG: hypothetical protein ACYC6O_04285 [Thermoleophilia bacterium]